MFFLLLLIIAVCQRKILSNFIFYILFSYNLFSSSECFFLLCFFSLFYLFFFEDKEIVYSYLVHFFFHSFICENPFWFIVTKLCLTEFWFFFPALN